MIAKALSAATSVSALALTGLLAGSLALPAAVSAQDPGAEFVTFEDIASDPSSGLAYDRVPSASNDVFDAIKLDPPYDAEKRVATPMKARGAPGVAVLDYDNDGDLDIYVTNGPVRANSLFSSQLKETGGLTFVDVGAASGAGLESEDSTGVCFGDIDNDGDHDLYVLSNGAPNRLLRNFGGIFEDITESAGVGGGDLNPAGCSMGDVNGDGYLDIAVANTFDWDNFQGIFSPFEFNQHNQLFVNLGEAASGRAFSDESAAAGLENLAGFPPANAGSAGLTWALALVDYDVDGDVDLFFADDQGGVPPTAGGGVDRGLVHLLSNDGDGQFTDISVEAGTNQWGSWMGFAFGDYDCSGTLDTFITNFGDYQPVGNLEPGTQASRWFLQRGDGTFSDPGVGDLISAPFGWGASTLDYDNDGDADIVFHGGHDVGPGVELSNPGVLLENQGCSANFTWDQEAFANSADHLRRVVHGTAVGDLDQDGDVDIVSVANFDIQPELDLLTHSPLGNSPFDNIAALIFTFEPDAFGDLTWNGNVYPNGSLAVELNQGGNESPSIAVRTVGGKGLTLFGKSNRDGIGATVSLRVPGEIPQLRPVIGGSSYASQDALEAHFGLGDASGGTVEVTWPGGTVNRLYNVTAGERITFPEIPCSFSQPQSYRTYLGCVTRALDSYKDAGIITQGEFVRFLMSALRAFDKNESPNCSASEPRGLIDLLLDP
ncbi:MAG: CRTAC1 family protein [Acidobacteriota bacterium]